MAVKPYVYVMRDLKNEKPLKRLETKTTIENLWIYVLALLKDSRMYAYEINRSLEKRFGFSAGQVTAYVVLYKLEKSGLVEAEWEKIGRNRKYYRITPEGEKLLEEGILFLEEQARNIRGSASN
jgi:DNA-binding PadR family transcriptional regulator